MKNHVTIAAIAFSQILFSANAQDKKLAIAPVEATATLVKKIASLPATGAIPIVSPATSDDSALEGEWSGYFLALHLNDSTHWPCTLTISKDSEGYLKAYFQFSVAGKNEQAVCHSVSITRRDKHVRMAMRNPANNATPVMDGDIDASGDNIKFIFSNGTTGIANPVFLRRTQKPKPAQPDTVPGALRVPQLPPVDLSEITRKLEVQLAARIRNDQQFLAMDGPEFKALQLSTNRDATDGRFDLKTTNSLASLSKAGVDYVLVTTLEDFQDQTLDNREWTASYRQYSAKRTTRSNRGWGWSEQAVAYNAQAALESVFTQNGSSSLVQFSKETEKLQLVFVEVQCKLYEAKTGELRQSGNYSFVANRFYSAVADTSNHRDTGDLYLQAARAVADSTATWIADGLTPMMVLKRDDKTITINRGLGARLKVGEVFGVYGQGAEIPDPITHKSLGADQVLKGRVAVSEVNEKFTKATILGDDDGIIGGELLRKMTK